MGIYDAWRKDGGPTLYPSLKSAVTADVLEVGFIFAFVIVAFSFFIILPGFRGKEVSFLQFYKYVIKSVQDYVVFCCSCCCRRFLLLLLLLLLLTMF